MCGSRETIVKVEICGRPRSVIPGTQIELKVGGVDRTIMVRFVETTAGGIYLQLPLNHAHLTYMAQVLTRLQLATAA